MSSLIEEGEVLAGKYRVERVLGQGGMGVVVAATHVQLDQKVALKFLLPEAAANAEASARFLREARASVKLRSEHVARVLDVGTLDTGAPYIVMEYLEGHDLHHELQQRGHLPVDEAIDHALQACEALAEAHGAGIVHRDLKPANLFLAHRNDGSPCIKILDFGISKITEKESASMTRTSTVLGTPFYMSPEQLRSSRQVDARADVWSLGIILYELLTGQVPFRGETLPEVCAAILTDPLRPPRELNPAISPELDLVICQCLEKSPDNRYQGVDELGHALSLFHSDGSAFAARISRISRREGPTVPTPRQSSPRVSIPDAATLGPSAITSPTTDPGRVSVPVPEEPLPVASPRSRVSLLIGAFAAVAVIGMIIGGASRSSNSAASASGGVSPPIAVASAVTEPIKPASHDPVATTRATASAPPASAIPVVVPTTPPATSDHAAPGKKPDVPRPRPIALPKPGAGDIDFGARK